MVINEEKLLIGPMEPAPVEDWSGTRKQEGARRCWSLGARGALWPAPETAAVAEELSVPGPSRLGTWLTWELTAHGLCKPEKTDVIPSWRLRGSRKTSHPLGLPAQVETTDQLGVIRPQDANSGVA